jgi:hypothetical protein
MNPWCRNAYPPFPRTVLTDSDKLRPELAPSGCNPRRRDLHGDEEHRISGSMRRDPGFAENSENGGREIESGQFRAMESVFADIEEEDRSQIVRVIREFD